MLSPAIGIMKISLVMKAEIWSINFKNWFTSRHLWTDKLILHSEPNFLIESSVLTLIFVKFNLVMVYPPPFERETWHYQKANIEKLIHENKIIFGCSRRSNNKK